MAAGRQKPPFARLADINKILEAAGYPPAKGSPIEDRLRKLIEERDALKENAG